MRAPRGRRTVLAIARGVPTAPSDAEKHFATIDVLSRDIRQYTANMFDPNMPAKQADLIASLIEEEDWTASLGETLYQVARRIERQSFGQGGRELIDATLDQIAEAMHAITPATSNMPPVSAEAAPRLLTLLALRDRCLKQGGDLPWVERGAILTILGSAERAFYLVSASTPSAARCRAQFRQSRRFAPDRVRRVGRPGAGVSSLVPPI